MRLLDVRGRKRLEVLVELLLFGSAGASDSPKLPKNDYLLVSTDPQDDEATAAASILCMSIEEELLGFAQNGTLMCADHKDPDIESLVEAARALVVVLSSRTMESLPQLTAIVPCMWTKNCAVVPVTTPSFQFPGANFYDTVLPAMWTGDVLQATALFQFFFRTIAVHLPLILSLR